MRRLLHNDHHAAKPYLWSLAFQPILVLGNASRVYAGSVLDDFGFIFSLFQQGRGSAEEVEDPDAHMRRIHSTSVTDGGLLLLQKLFSSDEMYEKPPHD